MLLAATLMAATLGGISPTAARAATGTSYVGRVASATLAASSTSATLTATSQVAAGDSLLVGILLSSTPAITGAVSVTDTAAT